MSESHTELVRVGMSVSTVCMQASLNLRLRKVTCVALSCCRTDLGLVH